MSTQNVSYNDENSSSRMQLANKPLGTTMYGGTGLGAAGFVKPTAPGAGLSKPAADKDSLLARRVGRTALGDISNRVTEPAPAMGDAKKKLGLATSNAQSTAGFQAPSFYRPVSGGPAASLLEQHAPTGNAGFAPQPTQASQGLRYSAFSAFSTSSAAQMSSTGRTSGASMMGIGASTAGFDTMGEGRVSSVLDTHGLLDDAVGRLSSNMTELSLQASSVRESVAAAAAAAAATLVPAMVPTAPAMTEAERITVATEYPLTGIDAAERHEPQMVSVYVDDIMEHLRNTEARRHPSPTYMTRQTDINAKMREILIDWLVEVHLKFKLRQETLYLTVNIIDRFLERRAVSRSKLQLVGCTAMLLASKYEEIFSPEVQDFVYVTDKAYTREQILAMETIMLNALEFNLTVPYSMRFAERYARFASESEQFTSMVMFLIELTLQDYRFLRYMPSMIAASAVSLALHLSGHEAWPRVLQEQTQYNEAEIRSCVMDLWMLAAQENPKYRAVRKKYSSSRFHGVGKITIDPPSNQ